VPIQVRETEKEIPTGSLLGQGENRGIEDGNLEKTTAIKKKGKGVPEVGNKREGHERV